METGKSGLGHLVAPLARRPAADKTGPLAE